MHKVSSKPQVTLPKGLCDQTGISPGDYVEIFEFNGKLTVIKKVTGSSAGSLKHIKPRLSITDNESLQDALDDCR